MKKQCAYAYNDNYGNNELLKKIECLNRVFIEPGKKLNLPLKKYFIKWKYKKTNPISLLKYHL